MNRGVFAACFLAAVFAQDVRRTVLRRWTEGITDLSGLAALGPFADLPYDDQDLASICALKQRAVRNAFQATQDYLEHLNAERRDPLGAMKLHHQMAQLYCYQGDMRKAIEHFEAALVIASERALAEFQRSLEEKLGVAHLRRGEVENCIQDHAVASCIFPLRADARHKLASGSERAVEYFLKVLAREPENLEVRWLLNVAYMTLGKYPEAVPKQFLIPPEALESREKIGRFLDIAPALGLDTRNMAGGVIVEDFDDDGFLDVVISSQDSCAPLRYFRNNGDGTFRGRSFEDQLGGLNLVQTDYNNDGRPDIFVLRGGWEFPMRNSLLRNNGDGSFTDVTEQAGLARPATASQTAAWADFDNDGDLDVFVGNEFAPSQLFRNNGDGTFTDVAAAAGVNRVAFTKAAIWGDYDNDGFPDLYVSNYGEDNFLYHNNGDGTFTEVARQLGVEKPLNSFSAWFMDYDNDGRLDLFVSGFVQSVADVARCYFRLPPAGETFKVYHNTGAAFEEVSERVGMKRNALTMGCNFGDIDNDGWLDFYLGTGAPSYAALVPNLLMRNQEGKAFADVTASSGTGHLQKGHGIAFADLNNDGYQEIFLHNGGAVPGDAYANSVFRNPGNGNRWIVVRLVGEKSNSAAVGARIVVTLPGGRRIHRVVSSGGSFGASSFQQHIGLGRAQRIEALEIWWPATKSRQRFTGLAANQFIEIREFASSWRKLQRRSFPLPEAHASAHH